MADLELQPGQILNNRYRLEHLLGQGGMGQVFLAQDLSSECEVALKTFGRVLDQTDRRRFEREIRTLQTIDHSNIVPFRDLGWSEDFLFYTMDYLPGVTLEQVIAASGPAESPEDIDWYLRVLSQVCEALTYLHKRRIVHRDIKPSNILLGAPRVLTEQELEPADWLGIGDVRAQLTDFGLVKTRGDRSLTQSAMGTPQYMSPEQIEASPSVDSRTDLYSLGVILYRVVCGRFPFERLSEALSRQRAPSIRDNNPSVPELYEELAFRLLEFEPYQRPGSASEVSGVIGAILDRKDEDDVSAPAVAKLAQPSFCGRENELALLKETMRTVARGHGRWVSITGERGAGKTWLVSRSDLMTTAAVEEGLNSYLGTFVPRKAHKGFQDVLIEILSHFERHDGPERVAEVLGRWGRHLRAVFPLVAQHGWLDLCPEVDESIPQEVRDGQILDTVVGALIEYAETEPRIIVLEDLHYLDDFDMELLQRLLINALNLPVLLITTHRPEVDIQERALDRLLNEYRVEEKLVQIEIPRFDREEISAMVGSLLTPARRIPDEFVQVLEERTDGIPLYLLHFINSLWNKKLIQLSATSWEVDVDEVRRLPVPETTRSHFMLVLDEIPSAEARVLNLAAILGLRFSFDVMLELVEVDEFALDTLCRNLVHAGILVEHQDGFRFLHSFEQEIILSRLSAPMRLRLHARVGKVLENFYGAGIEEHLGEVAEHMYRGGDQAKGLDYLRRAARKAEEAYALRTALEYYGKALELTNDPLVRRRLLDRIGELYTRLGDYEQALEHFREAVLYYTAVEEALLEQSVLSRQQHEDLSDYARLLRKFGEVYLRQGNYGPALDNFVKCERISRLIEDTEEIALSLVRQGNAHYSLDDPNRAEEAYSTAIELFGGHAPGTALLVAFTGLGHLERRRGNLEKALEHNTAALDIAQKIGDSFQMAGIFTNFGILYRAMGRLREATESYERSIEISERLGDRPGLAKSTLNLGHAQFHLGDFRRALEALTRAREICQATGDRKGLILSVGNLGMVQFYLGNFRAARKYFQEYLDDSRRLKNLTIEADALNSLGLVALELNKTELAEEYTMESLACCEKVGNPDLVVVNRVQLARIRGREGKIDETLEIVEKLRNEASERRFPEWTAHSLRIEAEAYRLLGNLERAQECGEQALASFEEQTQPYHQAVCCRTLGKIYRDMGFYWADQAGKYFERSLRVFEMLGARHALAVTQVEYGVFLSLLEEVDRAKQMFTSAETVFEELGTGTELARVRRELKEIS